MFMRFTACLLADPLTGPFTPECFRHFIASVPAPAATGWSESCRVGFSPHWSSAPFHGALRHALKKFRAISTRYDKLSGHFLAAIQLVAVHDWICFKV